MKNNRQTSRPQNALGLVALALFILLSGALPGVGAATIADFKARTSTNALLDKLPYRLFIPRNYESTTNYPLVLFLHGSGQSGTDNGAQFQVASPLVFVSNANQTNYPCFMVAPQCPTTRDWINPVMVEAVLELLTTLQSEFTIDPDRVYITGLSMGGLGTWALITRDPSRFAAAVPMSGGGDWNPLHRVTNLPVWNFHGAVDDAVPVNYSDYVIRQLRAAGGNPIYTRYKTGSHGIWDTAYNTPGLVAWVMEQRRGVPSSLSPLVSITTSNATEVSSTSSSIDLTGTLSGGDVTVTNVVWLNSLNSSTGQVSGITNWSAADIPLTAGGTNVITITALGKPRVGALQPEISFNATLSLKLEDRIRASITAEGRSATISWTGGTPLYTLEVSTNLLTGGWTNFTSTPETNRTVFLSESAAFYRVAAPPLGSPTVTVNDFIPKTYRDTNGGTLPYRLFVPSEYDALQKYPLVVFFHGHPERGTDNEAQLTYQPSPLVFVSPANQAKHPCFMVAPQCPPEGVWSDPTRRRQIRELVNVLQANYSLDTNRLYVTGLSVGGSAVWDSLTQNPDLFAAGIPIAAGALTSQVLALIPQITNSTVWAFKAADDEVFNALDTDRLINQFRKSGGAAIYTRYLNGGHAIWNPAYATPGLVDWLMAQRKGAQLAGSAITITSPTEVSSFTTAQTNFHLAGAASSITGPITNVVWTNILTRASGITPGSTNWSFERVPLSPNATNLLIVTFTSGSGSVKQPGVTTANDSIFVISRSTP